MTNSLKQTILGISLFNGHLAALAVVKGKVTGRWVCERLISTGEELQAALQAAVQATKFPGTNVSFLVEDVQFVHQYLQVPPMRPTDRDRYITRKAVQEKPVDSEIVWRCRDLLKAREMEGVVLDICDKSYVDKIITACQQLRLTPVMVVPLTVLFEEQIRSLSLEPDESILVVTATPHGVALLAATGDGKQFFNRFLNIDLTEGTAARRLGREITRSVMFADQQFGVTIGNAWVIAEPQTVSVDAVEPHVNIPISASPLDPDPSYWTWVSLMLPTTHASNFVPRWIRSAWKMTLVRRIAAGVIVAWGCAMMFVEAEILLAHQNRDAVIPHMTAIQTITQEWQQRVRTLQQQREWSQGLAEERDPMLVAWVLGVVAEKLPEHLVLDAVSLSRDGDEWVIDVAGTSPPNMTVSAKELEAFQQSLMETPLHVRVTTPWREVWMKGLQAGSKSAGEKGRSSFQIVGRIGRSSS